VSIPLLATRQRIEDPHTLWLGWEASPRRISREEERAGGEAKFEELFSDIPPEKRGRALRRARFHDPALVEILLEKSAALQLVDPPRADALAILAATLSLKLQSPAPVAAYLARANTLSGNARRLVGRNQEAEIAFGNAVFFLSDKPLSADRAFFCRYLAFLRWEEGKIDEAHALLGRAAEMFEDPGNDPDGQEYPTTQALRGLLAWDEGDVRSALDLFSVYHPEFPAMGGRRPWLDVRTRLAFAAALAACGFREPTEAVLTEAVEFYAQIDDPAERLRIKWWEGRARSLMGQLEQGMRLLETVRRCFLEERRVPEAALASLDVGQALAARGSGAEVGRLADEYQSLLGDEEGGEIGVRALRQLHADLEVGNDPGTAVSTLSAFVRRTLRFRGFRVDPLPFA
jgi:tetratricopeptide (TPR) repeat protein